MNFSTRSTQEEIMDDLNSQGYELEQSLRELAIINKWLGGQKVLFDGLNQLKNDLGKSAHPVKIADLGCGGGDLLWEVQQWWKKHHIPLTLEGYDANPHVTEFAKNWVGEKDIQFHNEDVFSGSFARKSFDIVLLTLFCHHMKEEILINFLKQLKTQTSTAIIINDLHRHRIPYYFIKTFSRLFSKTPMVKHDGPLSILRAFKRAELEEVMEKAGIENYRIKWFWPFRWQVLIRCKALNSGFI